MAGAGTGGGHHRLTVTALAGRGDGVARLQDGRVVFVPETAPGDVVSVALEGRRQGVLRGRVVELLEAGAARVSPRCPVASTCGGCSWQHVSVQAQREQKERNLRRALHATLEPVGEVPPYGWRRRVRFHLRRVDGQLRAGYMRGRSDQLVATTSCPVLAPALEELLTVVPQWADGWLERGECLAQLGREGVVLRVQGVARSQLPTHSALAPLGEDIVGVEVTAGAMSYRWGETHVTLSETADSVPIITDAGGFTQASAAANAAIREAVNEALRRCGPRPLGVEFFAGSGNLTGALLAHCERVVTWEWDALAVERAKFGWAVEAAAGRLQQHVGDVERLTDLPTAHAVWLLDPGRPGAKALCRSDAVREVNDLIYVSCAPDTLGRDLNHLREAGLEVRHGWWIDTFPHTPHAEVVVYLSRS